ncbi:hypothetical protein HJFPF1_09226 [Paramyrothecium foliicola]|nr:hypothetical protein HJFPF1_09226 [Paramyrothecium foliicola]
MAMQAQELAQELAQPKPKPLFIYGTLSALPMLAWALTGDSTKTTLVAPLVRRAGVKSYMGSVIAFGDRAADYPAVIPDAQSDVEALLLSLETPSQRRKLDDFEGYSFEAVSVSVDVLDGQGQPCEVIKAGMYLWKGAN